MGSARLVALADAGHFDDARTASDIIREMIAKAPTAGDALAVAALLTRAILDGMSARETG